MDITVIVCTFNGASRLPETLGCLSEQVVSAETQWEVIVVDNASRDETHQVALSMASQFDTGQYRVLFEGVPGKARALQAAFAAANGRYFCIVDDDNLLDRHYLANAVEFLDAHSDVAVAGGAILPQFEPGVVVPEDFKERYADLLAIRDYGNEVVFGVGPVGAGMIGRTKLFQAIYQQIGTRLEDRVGEGVGCSEDLEKVAVVHRLGWRFAYVPLLRMKHVIPARRLTQEYIDSLTYAVMYVAPWLELVAGRLSHRSRIAHRCASVPDWTRALKYLFLSVFPPVHPKFRRAGHWSRFYRARARGRMDLARDFKAIRGFLHRVETASAELRPPLTYQTGMVARSISNVSAVALAD